MNNLTDLQYDVLANYLEKNPILAEWEDNLIVKDLMINEGGVFYPDTFNDDTEKYNFSILLTNDEFKKLCDEYDRK